MADDLIVLLGGQQVGVVRKDARSRLSFIYDDRWRERQDAYPLSVSMPLAAQEHGHRAIEAFIWGLLPDNEKVLERWAQRFQVSARNAFALVSHVGEDCAGAVQFVRPERLEACLKADQVTVEWLDDAAVAERLKTLRADHAAWRSPRDTGQFSLAGAQPKTAFFYADGRWGIPSGRTPTTHILKPPTGEFDGHAENEHFCLSMARVLGLPTASTKVAHFGDEVAIVIERYDRTRTGAHVARVHQEDMCQALGVLPTRKYENEGGPSAGTIIDLLRTHSSARDDDIRTFTDALILNWLIAGTDAHAKNYSLLIGNGGRVRLAPLYDVASVLPYDQFDLHRLKLAMKVGKEYLVNDIGARQWRRFAEQAKLDGDGVIARALELSAQVSDTAQSVSKEVMAQGLTHPLIPKLAGRVAERAAKCHQYLKMGEAS